MLKKVLGLLLTVTCIVVMSACGNKTETEENTIELLEPVNAKVETAYASKMDICQIELHDGAVLPSTEEFSFSENGYLYSVFVQPGDIVYEGDVLAAIVGRNYQTILDLEDEIKEAKDSLEEKLAKYDQELEIAILNGGDVSEKELEVKQKKELVQFELQLKEKRLETLKADDIGYVYITAPYDSRVAAVSSARENSYISKGTPVVALVTEGDPIITCDYITENNYSKDYECYAEVRGQRLELEYIPYTKNELKVIVNNGTVPVSKFRIKNLDGKTIYVGDYAGVIEVKNFKADVLAIPKAAVYSEATGDFVYEIKNGERVRRSVSLGISDNANVEIIDGLEEGVCVYVKN